MKSNGAAMLAYALLATTALGAEIVDGPAAIKRAQDICRLTPMNAPGQWQSKYVKDDQLGDEWHVWYGNDAKEPQCGFVGGHVKVDGSSTTCVAFMCNKISKAPAHPAQ